MENNCMADPCEGCTEEACVEMMKKLQADKKVKQLLETGKYSNGEEVFGEMLDDMLFLSEMIDLQQVLFYLREKEGLSERMLDMLLTSILSNVDEISHKWEVYKDKAN